MRHTIKPRSADSLSKHARHAGGTHTSTRAWLKAAVNGDGIAAFAFRGLVGRREEAASVKVCRRLLSTTNPLREIRERGRRGSQPIRGRSRRAIDRRV